MLRQYEGPLEELKDTSDSMQHLWSQERERETIIDSTTLVTRKCEALMALLSCSSLSQINEVVDEFDLFPVEGKASYTRPLHTEQEKEERILEIHVDALRQAEIYRYFGSRARKHSEGNIIVEFFPPEGHKNFNYTSVPILSLEKVDETYILKTHVLPSIVPTDDLVNKFLSKEPQDIPGFVYSIDYYLWSYWQRDLELQRLKEMEFLQTSVIYHNDARTIISFTIYFLEVHNLEFKLHYERSGVLPTNVDYKDLNGLKVTNINLIEGLEGMKENLLSYPISEVVQANLRDSIEESALKSNSESSSKSSNGSTAFNLFE